MPSKKTNSSKTKYVSIRFWTKDPPFKFAFNLVEECEKVFPVSNFNLYGNDGHSYRIDVRVKGSDWHDKESFEAIRSKLYADQEWYSRILSIKSAAWDESEMVKQGHDFGSKLAIRLHKLGKFNYEEHLYILYLLVNRYWSKFDYPDWHKAFNQRRCERAVEKITEGVEIPKDFTLIERTLHCLLNNLGYGADDAPLNTLQRWWFLTQLAKQS